MMRPVASQNAGANEQSVSMSGHSLTSQRPPHTSGRCLVSSTTSVTRFSYTLSLVLCVAAGRCEGGEAQRNSHASAMPCGALQPVAST